MRLLSLCSAGMILTGTANSLPLPSDDPNPQLDPGIPPINRHPIIYGRTCDILEVSSDNVATGCADMPVQASTSATRLLSSRSKRDNEESSGAKVIDEAFLIGKEPTIGGLMVPSMSQNGQEWGNRQRIDYSTNPGPEACPMGHDAGCSFEGLALVRSDRRPVIVHEAQKQDGGPKIMNESHSSLMERRYVCWPGDPEHAPKHRRLCPDQPLRSALQGRPILGEE